MMQRRDENEVGSRDEQFDCGRSRGEEWEWRGGERPSVALVLETNNLRSAEDAGEVGDELCELFDLLRCQTHPLGQVAEVVVTHDGLPGAIRKRVRRAAGRPIAWVQVEASTGYYAAKNAGFDATTADVVVFADSDCRPVDGWLRRMLQPFVDREARVVAGRTVYPDDTVPNAATAVDFLYFDASEGDGCVRNFYANNVAFERQTFDAYRYRPHPGVHRGHCLDLALRLREDGVPIHYAPGAESTHEWPDRWRDVVRKRLLRGADTSQVAEQVVDSQVPEPLARHLDSPLRATSAVLAGRLVSTMGALANADESRGTHKLAAAGLSMLDAVGATMRLAGVTDLGVRGCSAAAQH